MMEIQTMDDIMQARYNFVLAFQYCSNGKDFPVFRTSRVGEDERIHTGYDAIDLLDEALALNPDFQEARNLRGDIWHAILTENRDDNYDMYLNSETGSFFFVCVAVRCGCFCRYPTPHKQANKISLARDAHPYTDAQTSERVLIFGLN